MTVKEFAKKQGYVDALPLGKWHGYDAYEPVFDGDIAYVGPPLMILVKGETIRMSTPEEGYQQIDGAPSDIKGWLNKRIE